MALTLNQVISRIRTLSLAHAQVSDFYFGEPADFDIKGGDGDVNYPAVFLELQLSTVDRNTHQTVFRFRLYALDRVGVSVAAKDNEIEVLSDMAGVIQDILAMMMASDYQADWLISDVANFAPVREELSDMVAGHILDVEVSVDFLADRCQVPASDVTFETDFDMARTRILTYEGTGSEGASFTVTNLAAKTVLAIYRAGMYKRAITTTPVDGEHIGVTGTDLGSRKGILSTTGVVSLQSGDALVSGEILDFLIFE